MTTEKKHKLINIEALIFDLDGVITDTATIHAEAWKEMFDAFLDEQADDYDPLDIEKDYFEFIDGKPRYDGVQSFLESRGIDLPQGKASDKPGKKTICGLGNRKNEIYQKLLEEDGFTVFAEVEENLKKWRAKGMKTAVVSSSKNCKKILDLAKLNYLFDVRVDGVVREKLNLKGKPEPDIFLKAAEYLGTTPDKAALFEDAEAGVQAGRNGMFRQVIGVNRNNGKAELERHGAHFVISDFNQIRLADEISFERLPIEKLSSALDHHEEILNRLGTKQLAVFLDYDGTLTPIAEHPSKATLSIEMKEIIEHLAQRCTVAIISGRDLQNVKEKVDIDGLYYAGSHGLDIEGPNMKKEVGKEALPALEEAEKAVKEKIGDFKGARLERKKFVVAIHYRQSSEKVGKQAVDFAQKLADDKDQLMLVKNKKVVELRPNIAWNKGKAISHLLEELDLNADNSLPFFIGDDVTDEDGFEYLIPHGIGIITGDHGKSSYARYKLRDVDEVKKFLFQISDMLTRDAAYNWKVVYEEYLPDEQPKREALCTMGNGYFAARGACETSYDDGLHYPGTYLAGGYNRAKTEISGRIIENEDLVNWPNWLSMTFRVVGGKWFHIDDAEILDYQQMIDLKKGILERRLRFLDGEERETQLVTRRFVSQDNEHIGAIQWELEFINWSGKVELKSAIDGSVTNNGVERYQKLNGDHFEVLEKGKVGEKGIYMLTRTHQSRIFMAQAVRTHIFNDGYPHTASRETRETENQIEQVISFEVERLVPVRVEKVLALHTSNDVGHTEPLVEAMTTLNRASSFAALAKAHENSWSEIWKRFNIYIEGSQKDQMILRLHIFHLLQTVSYNSIKLDAGVPARGWHGEAYRGHIFWDEIYIFPFLNMRVPEITKGLLMYRYHRLKEARENARNSGFKGAMFPWQSGSNGREESQELHLNPKSGQWIPDNTYLQRHISADIVFNIMQYFYASNDMTFMTFYGAEIVMEVANFFSSMAEWSNEKERYVINNVVGPDEYHTSYPHSDKPGIDNNTYTNVMATYVLKHACVVYHMLTPTRKEEIRVHLDIDEEDFMRWDKVGRNLFIPFVGDHIIAQFEGYEELKELDLDAYRKKYGKFLRMDRILQAEGDNPNRYKTSKQADVMMLFYLFSSEELQELFDYMGYDFNPEIIKENIDYYNERTSHGSTLSKLVHSWVKARSERAASWESFEEALVSDFEDVQGGTTSEGIHLGAMAGTVDLMQRCYSGVRVYPGRLSIHPLLPMQIEQINFKLHYRSNWIDVKINHQELHVEVTEGRGPDIHLTLDGKTHKMKVGDSKTIVFKKQVKRTNQCNSGV